MNAIESLDVPASVVASEAVLREMRARHTAAKDWDEAEFVALDEAIRLVTHPDAPVSTDSDYPGFAEQLAARSNKVGGTR